MALTLPALFDIENTHEYKFHAARWNGDHQPLDVFIRDREEWFGWNTWRGSKDEFNRKFILSFIDCYQERHTWLFGGLYEVEGRGEARDHSYAIKLCERGSNLIGRLKITVEISRGRAFRLENLIDRIRISELLKEPYTGEPFAGFDNVSLDFPMLEAVIRNDRMDWKTALQNVKGVYVIVDRKTGKKYVGSAYNEVGIWARWRTYAETGHGGNIQLVALTAGRGVDYARESFRITLLETWPFRTEDKIIIGRESFWKDALLTRGDFGYNGN